MGQHSYAGLRPGHDAFGRPIRDLDQLSYTDRVLAIRRLAGSLQAQGSVDAAWLGRCLSRYLAGESKGDLVACLGLHPPSGDHRSPAAMVARERRDSLLIQLSIAAGGDRAALRMFQEGADVGQCAQLVEQLRANPPGSPAAFTRARKRSVSAA